MLKKTLGLGAVAVIAGLIASPVSGSGEYHSVRQEYNEDRTPSGTPVVIASMDSVGEIGEGCKYFSVRQRYNEDRTPSGTPVVVASIRNTEK